MSETPAVVADDVFDLEAQRTVRREMSGKQPIRLVLNSNTHTLPDELPIDVFAPLETIELDVAMLLRLAMESRAGREGSQDDLNAIVIDMLVGNPSLPKQVIEAIRQCARALLGSAAYDDLIAMRPSREDLGDLAQYLLRKYGVSLPEASGPSDSSDDGGPTSSPTSSVSTDSTPEVSGATPESPASSELAASSV